MGTTFSHFKVNNFPKLKRKPTAGSVIVTLGDSQLQGKTEQTRITFKVESVYGG